MEAKLGGNYNPGDNLAEVGKVSEAFKEPRLTHVGDVVVWHDATGVAHKALVTAVWSANCINVVFVSSDETRQDGFGRQIERATSCSHKLQMNVHGYYWRFEDEEPNGYTAPLER